MFETLRNKVFWFKDKLSGNIRNQYDDISRQMQEASSTIRSSDKLSELLSHSVTAVEYYRRTVPKHSKLKLEDFPIINKSIIKDNYDEFLSERHRGTSLHSMSTSGSTGTPFKILQCKDKRERVLAELIYFNMLAEQNIGDKFMYFRVWTKENRKSFFSRVGQNIVCVDIHSLDDQYFSSILDVLEHDRNIKSCLGYAHVFEYLCRYVERSRGKIEPPGLRSIITSSEVVPMNMKRRMKKALGCNVYDRYSNQENGIIAQSGDCSDLFIVNYPSYLVEVLREDADEPVCDGEMGRIVITDLFNFAMPMIRYDTGDLAIKVGSDKFACHLKSIQGRQVDIIYDCQGRELTPHTLTNHMWSFDKLSQYQFIQEGEAKYRLRVAGAEGKYSEQDFLSVLYQILGGDADIEIEYIDSIPVLASGKFKKIVCNYRPVSR